MRESAPQGHTEPKKGPQNHAELFCDVSGAKEEDAWALQSLAQELPSLLPEPFDAALKIRGFLIEKGFEYDERYFQLGDVMSERKGNCLGLSLLLGALLEEKGIRAGYEIISNPKDPLYRLGLAYFNELKRGDYFSFDNPVLPSLEEAAEYPQYRFAPVEHPVLLLGDKTFETTDLEIEGGDPSWLPESDARRASSYTGVCSMVYIDRAKSLIMEGTAEAEEVRRLCEKALALDAENVDAQYLLWDVAQQTKDPEGARKAREAFLQRDRTDSKYLFEKYQMTGTEADLYEALQKDPTNILAFYEKYVIRETDNSEARFNAAVAAWCIANSAVLDLDTFYTSNEERIKELFGEEVFRKVRDKNKA